jgi:O-antigen/teichoic acid export membrane protein
VAAERKRTAATVAELTACRLANAVLAGSALVLAALAISRFSAVGWLVLAFGLSLAPLAMSLEWAFAGLERMDFVGLSRLTAAATWFVLVVVFVRRSDSLLVVPLAYVAGLACGAWALFLLFRRAYGPTVVRFDLARWTATVREAAPIGVSLIVIQVYVGFGLVALGVIEGDRAVGLYAAPQRIVLFLSTISSLFGATIYPRLAALHTEGRAPFERMMRLGLRVMVWTGVPLGIGGALVAPSLVAFVYGSGYEESVAVFQWLAPSLILIFANVPFGYSLLAAGERRAYLRAAVAGAVVSVVANVALIPRLHLLGPVVATLCAEGVVLVMLVVASRRVAHVDASRTVLTTAASAALMAGVLFFMRSAALPVQVGAGAAAYAAGLVVFRAVTWSDVTAIRDEWLSR